MYRVSVIVCVYNMEKYLEECLNSLANQTLEEIEIVIVNDGSTDKSLSIIEKFCKDYNNFKMINQKNRGLGGARNTGIQYSTGEYIGFVDADDFVAETMFEKLYNEAKTNNSDIVICDYNFYPQKINSKKKWFKEYKGVLNPEFIEKNTQPWNKIVRKELINEIKFLFFEQNGDGAYINLFLNAKKISTINDKLYFYRVGHSSMSSNHSMDKYVREVEVAQRQMDMLNRCPQLKESLLEYFEYRIIYTSIQALSVACLHQDKRKYQQYKEIIKELDYKKNTYTKIFLKTQFSKIKYLGMIYFLPNSYILSSKILKYVL